MNTLEKMKSKQTAILLTVFLGFIGVYKFYLEKNDQGYIVLANWIIITTLFIYFPLHITIYIISILFIPTIDLFHVSKDIDAFNKKKDITQEKTKPKKSTKAKPKPKAKPGPAPNGPTREHQPQTQ